MPIVKCALKRTANDLGISDLATLKRYIKEKIFDISMFIGIFIIPIILVTWVSTHTILFILSCILPEFYQDTMIDGSLWFPVALVGLICGVCFDYVFMLFVSNCWECYDREKRRKESSRGETDDRYRL